MTSFKPLPFCAFKSKLDPGDGASFLLTATSCTAEEQRKATTPCTHHISSRRLQQTHGGGHEFVSSKPSTRTSPALVFFLREHNTLVRKEMAKHHST
uniref:Uncharacterized protein n=1 Tax=Anas zonorhyncha TaxID=75864 RepID=A0A8C0A0Y5_9AVES